MTIAELRAKLEEFPPDYEVLIDIEGIDITDTIPVLFIDNIQPDNMNGYCYIGTKSQITLKENQNDI